MKQTDINDKQPFAVLPVYIPVQSIGVHSLSALKGILIYLNGDPQLVQLKNKKEIKNYRIC